MQCSSLSKRSTFFDSLSQASKLVILAQHVALCALKFPITARINRTVFIAQLLACCRSHCSLSHCPQQYIAFASAFACVARGPTQCPGCIDLLVLPWQPCWFPQYLCITPLEFQSADACGHFIKSQCYMIVIQLNAL